MINQSSLSPKPKEHPSAAMIRKHSSPLMITALFLLWFSINLKLSEGTDSITVNQSLSANQTIVSAGGSFELGFFTPGKSSRYYAGIWYKNISQFQRTIVWVANRETPILDINSAELKISDGNLVLSDNTQVLIWSTNLSSTTSNSVIATLRDDGNLVLHDGSKSHSNDEGFWQSFDYPGDTWLPGAKLGFNKRTRTHFLISWKNSEDPALGRFSVELDPIGRQYIIRWNRTEPYWASGSWNGHIFSLMPEMSANNIYNITYVRNVNESYVTYSNYNRSIASRLTIDVSGLLKMMSWSEGSKEWTLFWSQPSQCQVYAYCGAFSTCSENTLPCSCLPGFRQKSVNDWNLRDYSDGCEREINLQQCRNGRAASRRQDQFLAKTQVSLPKTSQNVSARTVGECESVCLNNCSCTAYTYDGNTCLVWNGELLNLQQLSGNDGIGRTINIRLAALSSQFSKKKKNKGVVIGSIVGSVTIVMLLLAIVSFLIWRRMSRRLGTNKVIEGSLVAFGYKDLQVATKNFSYKLGGGGFGAVFKGTLPDSTVIAVKKLQSISQGEKQFRTEVSTIGTIQHVNLIRLHGFCSDRNKKLLVYEYMKNGSLDAHLFNANESNALDWKTRYQIMLGIAQGLTYLHEKCRNFIIHCDIKPENILLDGEFCPKVADFGLAKLLGREFSRVITTLRGTRGYLAPEWISGVAITAKADVYSYGMMLFEFISGRRNSEQAEDGTVRFFPSFAAKAIAKGSDIIGMLDPALDGNADVEEVAKICKVACWCIQDEENMRPSMGHVVQILEGVADVNLPPIPRSMKLFVETQENIIFFMDSSSGQSS